MHLTKIELAEPSAPLLQENTTKPISLQPPPPLFSPINPNPPTDTAHVPKPNPTAALPPTGTETPLQHEPIISVHLPNDPVHTPVPLLPPVPTVVHPSLPKSPHIKQPKTSRSVVLGVPPKSFAPTLKPFLIPVFRSRDLPSIFLRDVAPIPAEKPKGLPSFFDFFRHLPTFPPFKNVFAQHSPPFSDVPRISSPIVTDPLFILKTSPPISWTFCDPICGSGDQAVDAESALENVQQDIKEGIEYAFKQSHLSVPSDDQYHPNSTILEDFGKYYGWDGFQYVTLGNVVAYRRHKEDNSKNGQFFVEVRVKVKQNGRINTSTWRQIGKHIQTYLKLNKGARFQEDISLELNDIKTE